MTIEEEDIYERDEKKSLREQLAQRDERIQQLEAMVVQQNTLIEQMQGQISRPWPLSPKEFMPPSNTDQRSGPRSST